MQSTISIPQLRAALNGRVITPDDARYDEARAVFYGGIDHHPAVIVRVADAADVSRVVELARETRLELAIRGGGHSNAGHGVSDGGIVLDLGDLRTLNIDVAGRTAWAETGLTAGEYTTAAGAHGLATGFGDTASVGIGGITLGGGVGFLVRKHGLTIDDLLEVLLRHCRKEPTLALETAKDVTAVCDLGDQVRYALRRGELYNLTIPADPPPESRSDCTEPRVVPRCRGLGWSVRGGRRGHAGFEPATDPVRLLIPIPPSLLSLCVAHLKPLPLFRLGKICGASEGAVELLSVGRSLVPGYLGSGDPFDQWEGGGDDGEGDHDPTEDEEVVVDARWS